MLFGKNFIIADLKSKLKIKDEIIERLVKNNENQPVVLLQLNEPNLQKVDFKELSPSPNKDGQKESQGSPPFVSLENSFGRKSGISPNNILYDVLCMNQLAKESFQNKILGPNVGKDINKKLNILDV